MVDVHKAPLHKAQSKMEADSWIAWNGPRNYPNDKLIIRKQGNEWHVYKG